MAVRYEDFDAYLRWRGTIERSLPTHEWWPRGWGDERVHFERRDDRVLLWRHRSGWARDVLSLRTERAHDGTTIVRHEGYSMRTSMKKGIAQTLVFMAAYSWLEGGASFVVTGVLLGLVMLGVCVGIPYLLSLRRRPLDAVAHLLLFPVEKGSADPGGAPFRSSVPFEVPRARLRETG